MALVFDKLDRAGVAELLKSAEFAAAVHGIAESIRGNVQVNDAEVVVDDYTTDRAASSVTIKHPQALAWQARDGVLTRAASGAGVEVTAQT